MLCAARSLASQATPAPGGGSAIGSESFVVDEAGRSRVALRAGPLLMQDAGGDSNGARGASQSSSQDGSQSRPAPPVGLRGGDVLLSVDSASEGNREVACGIVHAAHSEVSH